MKTVYCVEIVTRAYTPLSEGMEGVSVKTELVSDDNAYPLEFSCRADAEGEAKKQMKEDRTILLVSIREFQKL